MESLKHKGSLHSGAFSHLLSPIPAWASLPVPVRCPTPEAPQPVLASTPPCPGVPPAVSPSTDLLAGDQHFPP